MSVVIETPNSPRSRKAANWEKYGWLFMRISGPLLIVLIFTHLMVNLVLGDGIKAINFAFVAGKWADPFWQWWDFAMLWLAMIHGTNGMPVWGNVPGQPGVGELNGYQAFVTNQVPSNATKGQGTALSKMAFGKWQDAILALWGVLDLITDPYTKSDRGQVYVTGFQAFDFGVRHLESFAKVVDINTTQTYVS